MCVHAYVHVRNLGHTNTGRPVVVRRRPHARAPGEALMLIVHIML